MLTSGTSAERTPTPRTPRTSKTSWGTCSDALRFGGVGVGVRLHERGDDGAARFAAVLPHALLLAGVHRVLARRPVREGDVRAAREGLAVLARPRCGDELALHGARRLRAAGELAGDRLHRG